MEICNGVDCTANDCVAQRLRDIGVSSGRTPLREPMVERRDTLTATGYAVIDVQPSDIPAQRRLLAIRAAKLDAYRGLTEQVYGQYLDSATTVADMVVRSDSFRARVEGVVYGANLVQIEPRGGDTYEVTMSLDKVSSMISGCCISSGQ